MNNIHIESYNQARYRLRGNRYGWRGDQHTRESDRLLMFTIDTHAREESEHNLQFLLNVGQRHNARYLAITDYKIQYVSKLDLSPIQSEISNLEWYREFGDKEQGWRQPSATIDSNALGQCLHFRLFRHELLIKNQQGVYDLSNGERMTNRRAIIESFWDHGFATWRGRPLSVASVRHSGARAELEELTALADRHGSRYNQSDVAKKIWSAYNSIRRYAAWPGTW